MNGRTTLARPGDTLTTGPGAASEPAKLLVISLLSSSTPSWIVQFAICALPFCGPAEVAAAALSCKRPALQMKFG